MNRPQDNDAADDALLAFDSAILFLMSALDAVARVAHATLGLSGSAHAARWQRKDWRKRLAREAPELAALVAPGSYGGVVVEILTALRNTVHSAGLSSVGASTTRTERQRTLIDLTSGLSGDDLRDVLAAMDVLDGHGAWGIEALVPGRVFVDPGHLLEQVVVPTLRLLDGLMAQTPVESLPGVALSEAGCRPRRTWRIRRETPRECLVATWPLKGSNRVVTRVGSRRPFLPRPSVARPSTGERHSDRYSNTVRTHANRNARPRSSRCSDPRKRSSRNRREPDECDWGGRGQRFLLRPSGMDSELRRPACSPRVPVTWAFREHRSYRLCRRPS